MGASLVVIGSLISSLFFGFNDTSEINRKLISPVIYRFMKPPKYDGVEMKDIHQQDFKGVNL